MTREFLTKRNDGSDGNVGFSNQCMWLSILSYLREVLDNRYLTLQDLRNIASRNGTIPINGEKSEFDSGLHSEAISIVAEMFDLQIHIYHVLNPNRNNSRLISNLPNAIFGNRSASNVVSIISYGRHFELITSIDGRYLYDAVFGEGEKFIPNNQLFIGKKTNKNLDSLEKTQSETLDEFINGSIIFERCISDTLSRIDKINDELTGLTANIEYIIKNNNATEIRNDADFRRVMIETSYIQIEKLTEELKVCETNIVNFKKNLLDIWIKIESIVN